AGRPEQRAAVEALLQAHDQTGEFLDRPAQADPTTDGPGPRPAAPVPGERAGDRIGPYKLLQKIGEGGMGTVWMAEQETPVRRRVALKIIKPGLESDQIVARFEAERQALALMDHLNIAKVLDAGATPRGRPYFAMELVHGVPITRYCDENKLPLQERLRLFVPVCQAIQHAHQKGIIHRDIKPSNVLVTLYDGQPVPKVIDFGVAKAVDQRLTEKTMFTQYGQIVGTLEYMSPEQAEMSALGVDTRSDIYSLGVLLYELLTGTTPVNRKHLREAALVEILRIIKEDEPPRPSLRLSTTEELATIAASRGAEAGNLPRSVQGDLDWIVMKCLEKDRTRRYESAGGLARDLERHLSDEPVEACPPSLWYRWRKFTRRHRTAMTAATIAFWAIIGSQVITAWYAYKAAVANESNRVLAQGLQVAYDDAISERQRAEAEAQRAITAREAEAAARAELHETLDQRTAELRRSEAWRLAHAALVLKPQQPELVGPLVREALRLQDDSTTRSTALLALEQIPQLRPLRPNESRRFGYRLPDGEFRTVHRPADMGMGYWFAFTPDGQSLLVPRTHVQDLLRFDVASGQLAEAFHLALPPSDTNSAVLSPDGRFLATVADHQLHLWELPGGKLLRQIELEQADYKLHHLVISRDGRRLTAIAAAPQRNESEAPEPGREFEIWQWTGPEFEGRRLFATKDHDLHWLDVSSDGSRVAVMGRLSNQLIFIDATSASVLWAKPLSAMLPFRWVRVAPAGDALYVPTERGVRLIDAQTGTNRDLGFPDLVRPLANGSCVQASGHGDLLLVVPGIETIMLASYSRLTVAGGLHLIDFKHGVRRTLGLPSETFIAARLSTDGNRVVAVAEGGDLVVWDAPTGQMINRLHLGTTDVVQLALTPDGSVACLQTQSLGTRLIDLDRRGILPRLQLSCNSWVLAEGGRSLFVDSGLGRIWKVDAASLRPTLHAESTFSYTPFGRVLADGRRKLADDISNDQCVLKDVVTNEVVAGLPGVFMSNETPRRIFLAPRIQARSILAVVPRGRDKSIMRVRTEEPRDLVIFDALTGQERSTIDVGQPLIAFREGAISEDGRLVAFIPIPLEHARREWELSQIVIWDAQESKVLERIGKELGPGRPVPHEERVEGMVFSADARRLIIWRHDGRIGLWNRAASRWDWESRTDAPVRSAALSRDGQWLAASTEGEIRLWSLATGAEIFRLGVDQKNVPELAFVADDRFLLGVSNDQLRLWPVDLTRHLDEIGVRPLTLAERQRFGVTRID
ncbi:MAG TPA: protein kinase, partial [Gemmatales bacterium]|nr:protein kinase [Gemmatales bacterium]